jgi:hypothetical protein
MVPLMSNNVWLHLVNQNEEDVSFLLSELSKTPKQTIGLHTSLGGALSTRQRNYISGDGDAVNMYLSAGGETLSLNQALTIKREILYTLLLH